MTPNAQNELLKLTATFISNLGVATAATGVITPAIAAVTRSQSTPPLDTSQIAMIGGCCVIIALCLHLLARAIVRQIQ